MKNRNRILILNILSAVLIQGITFLSAPLFSRLLGTANYGTVAMYHTWGEMMSILFPMQVNATLHMARNRFPMEEQARYQSAAMGLGTVLYLLFSALCLLLLQPLSRALKLAPEMICVLLVFSFGQYCVSFLSAKYSFEFKAGRNFILSFVTTACSVGLSFLLVLRFPAETNHWGRILGEAITYAVLAVVVCAILFSRGKTFLHRDYWRCALLLGAPLVFHSLSGTLLAQSDRIMLRQFGSAAEVGIYSLSSNFSTVIALVFYALNSAWTPFYHEYSRTGQTEELKLRAKHYFELFTVLACGFVLLTPEVYHVFAERSYWDGTGLIFILSAGHYMVFLCSIPVNYELFRQKTKLVAAGTLLAAGINIALNAALIPRFGYYGAAWATAGAHAVQCLLHYGAAVRLGKGEFPFGVRDLLPCTVIFLAVNGFAALTPALGLLRWCLGALLGAWELTRVIRRKSIF
ncbi:MAG: oligosaccharide flippase family protein [Oscillospiraceae bacterium]|nr:oligosaccharide flippase family protein [Oscillospiraceae bacterium]